MDYRAHWERIAARIQGLSRAASLSAQMRTLATSLGDQVQFLADQCASVSTEIMSFLTANKSILPDDVQKALAGYPVRHNRIVTAATDKSNQLQLVTEAVVKLAAIEAEITYLLSADQQRLISLTERAIQHLKWSILSDEAVRTKWQTAYAKNEEACEKLGGAHLLLHGIFGFKTQAKGAITDLVAGEKITASAASVAEGLVLTEWKKATSQKDSELKIAEAQVQSDLYVGGILGGIELLPIRYIIVVSQTECVMPGDEAKPGYLYRHLNVATSPASPSVASKATVKASAGKTA